MTIQQLYNKGWLGIQLVPGIEYLDLQGSDENGRPITARVEANCIYQVTYLSPEGVGLFDLDKENSVAFNLEEKLWQYTSTHSDILH